MNDAKLVACARLLACDLESFWSKAAGQGGDWGACGDDVMGLLCLTGCSVLQGWVTAENSARRASKVPFGFLGRSVGLSEDTCDRIPCTVRCGHIRYDKNPPT